MNPLAHLRVAVDESLLVRLSRRLSAAPTIAPSRAPEGAWDSEFDDLADMLVRARVGRIVAPIAGAIGKAWRWARTPAAVRAAAATIAALEPIDRVRAAGIAILAASLTDLAVTPLDPRPASAARWSLWAAALVVGVATAAWPNHLAAAWLERRGARDGQDARRRG
jgi:hypothetical protein